MSEHDTQAGAVDAELPGHEPVLDEVESAVDEQVESAPDAVVEPAV